MAFAEQETQVSQKVTTLDSSSEVDANTTRISPLRYGLTHLVGRLTGTVDSITSALKTTHAEMTAPSYISRKPSRRTVLTLGAPVVLTFLLGGAASIARTTIEETEARNKAAELAAHETENERYAALYFNEVNNLFNEAYGPTVPMSGQYANIEEIVKERRSNGTSPHIHSWTIPFNVLNDSQYKNPSDINIVLNFDPSVPKPAQNLNTISEVRVRGNISRTFGVPKTKDEMLDILRLIMQLPENSAGQLDIRYGSVKDVGSFEIAPGYSGPESVVIKHTINGKVTLMGRIDKVGSLLINRYPNLK